MRMEEKNSLKTDIYLVINNHNDKETAVHKPKEIVVGEECFSENIVQVRHCKLMPSKIKSSLDFNIKLRKRNKCGRKSNPIKQIKKTTNNDMESDLTTIITAMKQKVKERDKLDYPTKKIMIDANTGQYSVLVTPRTLNNCLNFNGKSSIFKKLTSFKELSSDLFIMPKCVNKIPVSNACYSQRKSDSRIPNEKLTCCHEEIPEINFEHRFPEIHYIKGSNSTLNSNSDSKNSQNLERDRFSNISKASKVIYWQEGNIDKVTDPICLSETLMKTYTINVNRKHYSNVDLTASSNNVQSTSLQNQMATFSNIYHSWESVLERIKELEEDAMTRYISNYKTPTFKESPQPFKKIQFEMDTSRKDHNIVIPYNGVPFIFLGVCIYSCHLGKFKRSSDKEEEKVVITNSKKLGCPVTFLVVKLVRFPDFDISFLSTSAKESALSEVTDAWDFHSSRVRYYVEYYINEPKSTDHKFHEIQKQVHHNKFREPVDPRIVSHVGLLTKQGITSIRKIKTLLSSYTKDILFNGEEVPADRRRYNPSHRDLQYYIYKTKEEMKKEGRNVTKEHCFSLVKEITNSLMDVNNEQLLNYVESQLHAITTCLNDWPNRNIRSTNTKRQENVGNSTISILMAPKTKKAKLNILESSSTATVELRSDKSSGSNIQIFEHDPLDFLFENPSNENSENGSFYLTPQELAAGLNIVEHEAEDDNPEGLLYLIPGETFSLKSDH